ncbi:ATP-binding cassette domain-containing protein [Paracoccus aurantiacus]|uniref:ATP-binding cassette domain-containing protein n=1 Tax=Paracoccus aurantiacus TaxID=2599412 RepID=A0A5C6S4S3_9RHOB|nr:ATP-binding cassette domain-containing protein [Paracoccus aurantiacus]TXB69630.1 ATP-binding cassette domain-containing protein [Paracoccus aurantiacus]
MLSVERLGKSFGSVEVIRNVTLTVNAGERLVILGPNGAGKTTLMRLIAGEIAPDTGHIRLDGQDVTALPPDARARAGLGRGFQTASLFESFSIAENLILAIAARMNGARFGRDPLKSHDLRHRARAAARQVGIADPDAPVASIDHGTRRRLDLALAMSGGAKLLLLDEPASGFGPGGAREIHDLIAGLPKHLTLLVIEHDLDLAFAIADRIVILDAGGIAHEGPPSTARPVLRAIYDA